MGAYSVIFTFTRRTHLPLIAAASVFAALAGVVPPATSILVGKLMNLFSKLDAGIINGDDLELETKLWVLGLVILGSTASLLRAAFCCAWIINGELQARVVREDLFSSLVIREFEWFEAQTSGVGTLLGRIQVQIREFQLGVSQPLGTVVLTASQTISSLSVAFYFSWKLTLVLLAMFPLIALTLSFLNRGLQGDIDDQHREMINAARQATHATTNATLLKCYNRLPQEALCYEHILQLVLQHYRRQAVKAARQIAFMRLAGITLVVIALSFGAHLVHGSGASTGAILSTFWCCGTASKGFNDILAQSLVLEKGRASAVALKNWICLAEKGKRLVQENNAYTPQTLLGHVEFQNVTFSYSANPDQTVLNRLTLSFRACQTTFVVGRSGSGKSTISHLLLKLYTPECGRVTIDGIYLTQLDTNWLRNNVTVVQQDSVLFNETLSRNIALEFAMLTETISELSNGFNTMVGRGGYNLSGGQRQRVALARARLRDTPILILDECTSALDHTTRARLLDNIRTWRKDKTTVIITHDLSQIKTSDFTYVLRDGVVVAQGRRADLDTSSEWPSETNETFTTLLALGAGEGPVDGTTRFPPLLKYQNPSTDSLESGDTHDAFGEHVALLRAPVEHSQPIKPDRGRTFRAFLRSGDRGVAQQSATKLNNPDQELDMVVLNAVYEMSKMTNSRTIRNRLTMTQAARPYSVYPSLSTRLVNQDEQVQLPTLSRPPTSPTQANHGQYIETNTSQDTDATPGANKASFRRILATVWPSLSIHSRRWLVGALLMSIVYGAVPSVVSWVTVRLFQTFYQETEWVENSRKWSLMLMAAALVEATAAFCIHLTFETLAQKWINVLRVSALTAVINKPKSWFDEETRSINEICTTIDGGAEEMRNIFGRFVPFVLIVLIMILISIIFCLVKCWKLTMVGIGCAPVIYLVSKGFQMTSVLWESRTTDAVNKISDVFAESFCDIRTVRALTLESYFHRKFMTANLQAFNNGLKRAIYIGLCFGMSESLVPFIIAVVFKYAISVAQRQDYPTQNILVVLSSMIFTMLGASAILAFIPQISSSVESGTRLLQLIELDRHLKEHTGELKLNRHEFAGTVNLHNVTFSYPTRPDITVLKNVNLIFPPNKITAIVGQSGSGKSTILSLLLALYPIDQQQRDPTSTIKISGHDMTEFDITNLRSFISYVPQQPTLFPMRIRDNILCGVHLDPSTSSHNNSSDERLHSAAKAAGIHDFITTLPEGYDTLIGDGGTTVSGGQAQRIAVARALATRPKILLMDEPTSALDIESAGVIRGSIRALRREGINGDGATIIVVTHCEEMMRIAEKVVVFEGGRVVEEGGYFELMACRGRLRRLIRGG